MGTHVGGRTDGPAGGPRPTGPSTGSHHAVPVGAWRSRLPLLLAALIAVVLLAGGVLVGRLTAPGPGSVPVAATTAASTSPVAATPPASHPTMLADVVRVDSGDEVMVRVDGAEQTVAILGIAAPQSAGPQRATAQCGANAALRFADERLSGQTVTLVPDPTVPEVDDQGRRLAYVVLASQLSYTDAALLAGVVTADTGRKLWYAPVFAREQSDAVAGKRGLWGPPCRATPGRPLPAGS
jgi:endonuclease YncB( thermonuclease family)